MDSGAYSDSASRDHIHRPATPPDSRCPGRSGTWSLHSATRVRPADLPESTSGRIAYAQMRPIDLPSTRANTVEADLKAPVEPPATGLPALTNGRCHAPGRDR
ncbi:hypothetical protein Sme01_33480 [Sphaerisporangium melleum]|uniref:Uncharacterized protein n=1 Tax=Sphaerisporangium melleum TaxID=321316 RepID=A0A917QWR8_9ACTN|nr:hypothetical protein GCM10007964_16140 [Sphaerisporangium melleum]GII70872.1 hypothetical protein Sme01_33480 [Sphaerisporangium melleum]